MLGTHSLERPASNAKSMCRVCAAQKLIDMFLSCNTTRMRHEHETIALPSPVVQSRVCGNTRSSADLLSPVILSSAAQTMQRLASKLLDLAHL